MNVLDLYRALEMSSECRKMLVFPYVAVSNYNPSFIRKIELGPEIRMKFRITCREGGDLITLKKK